MLGREGGGAKVECMNYERGGILHIHTDHVMVILYYSKLVVHVKNSDFLPNLAWRY